MDRILQILQRIGLTSSEIKVYLALLRIGPSQKTNILREARIAPSKIYHVLDKLADKGLVSIVTTNNVKNFAAARPSRIQDYLSQKRKEIIEDEKILDKIIPKLESLQHNNAKIVVYIGWKGMETVYNSLVSNMKRKDNVYIIGAGAGPKEDKFELFFTKYGREAFSKNLNIKVIFNESARQYINKIEKNIHKKYQKRFLFENTPSELIILNDYTGILIRKMEPILILIQDSETANSFINYFNELWRIAKN